MRQYTEQVNFPGTDQYGFGPEDEDDIYTVDEFRALCVVNSLTDYDGYGHPVKDSKFDPGWSVKPSTHAQDIPEEATHIVWFNR